MIGDGDIPTPEQEARNLLKQYGVKGALTSGDVAELANFIAHAWAWRRQHGRCPHGLYVADDCSRCKPRTVQGYDLKTGVKLIKDNDV